MVLAHCGVETMSLCPVLHPWKRCSVVSKLCIHISKPEVCVKAAQALLLKDKFFGRSRKYRVNTVITLPNIKVPLQWQSKTETNYCISQANISNTANNFKISKLNITFKAISFSPQRGITFRTIL